MMVGINFDIGIDTLEMIEGDLPGGVKKWSLDSHKLPLLK